MANAHLSETLTRLRQDAEQLEATIAAQTAKLAELKDAVAKLEPLVPQDVETVQPPVEAQSAARKGAR